MAKKNYDSDFCGSLPLYNINLIQPYGYLVVLDLETFNVIQVSENIEELLHIKPESFVETPFEAYLPAGQYQQFKKQFSGGITEKIPLTLTLGHNCATADMLALVHVKSNYIILELEKVDVNSGRYFTDVFQEIKHAMANIEMASSVQEACKVAIHELKKLSGFDGIMMYRFDNDWNGTVIAEEKEEGMEKYLGLTFPASDIPKQARQMYQKNPYRLIPTREYTPVRLYPVINPGTKTFIDLSDCNMRSVAAVHLEYLKNMDVNASMSVRVLKDGQLWGLIACHHRTPKYLSYEICSVFELLSSVISNKISAIFHKEEFDTDVHLQEQRSTLVEQVYTEKDLFKGLLKTDSPNLKDMFNASGVVVAYDGRLESLGEVPQADEIENLVLWLQGKEVNKTFSNNNFAAVYEDAANYSDIASGILAVPIDADKGNYIICFRPEVIQTINWGGNPDQAMTFENDGKTYHPRNSFKLWQQTVRQTSAPWTNHEVAAAETLRGFVFEFQTKRLYN